MTQPEDIDLSKCVVCGGTAQFTDADPGANPVSYDSKHLPKHFEVRALNGQMPLRSGATKDELMERAQELDVEGRSTMTKTQLETAVAAGVATAEAAQEIQARRDPRDPVRPEPVRPEPVTPTPPAPEPVRPEPTPPAPPKPVRAARRKKGS